MSVKAKGKAEAGKPGDAEIHFKCRLCGKEKPLQEMRTVTRFNPVLVVCEDCARTLR
jgi:ribosome-binding protein aMBF1 (putative translation factor)